MVVEVRRGDIYFKHRTNIIEHAKPRVKGLGKPKWEDKIEVYNKHTDKLIGVTTYFEKELEEWEVLFIIEEEGEKC